MLNPHKLIKQAEELQPVFIPSGSRPDGDDTIC